MKSRILLVDDDQDTLVALRDRLEMMGYEILTAEDGAKALQAIDHNHPNLMLLDLELPILSGLDVLEQLARRRLSGGRYVKLPVIVMTAYGSVEAAAASIRAGACNFVPKPFDWDRLSTAIHDALRTDARREMM
jgi:DNA-binding NtrC family response regulator